MNTDTNKYPDGTLYVDLGFPWSEKNVPIDLFKPNVFRLNTYEDLFRLEALSDALTGVGGAYDILIPSLIHAQDDRRWKKGQSYGLSIVLKRLLALKNLKYHFFHVHNESVVEMAFNIVGQQHRLNFIDNSQFLHNVLDYLAYKPEELIILSADAGGYKWIHKTVDKLDWKGQVWSASKYRVPATGKMNQLLPTDDFDGMSVLIVDDISIYGGTFKGLSKLLNEANVGKKYLAVSCMTVQDLGEDPVTNYFDKVFCTNSKFEDYTYTKTEPGAMGLPSRRYFGVPVKNLEIIKLF